jgi:hypothetical protein
MRVDFPAPFSPTKAWISPRFKEKSTFSRAFTPGKVFEILFIVRIKSLSFVIGAIPC